MFWTLNENGRVSVAGSSILSDFVLCRCRQIIRQSSISIRNGYTKYTRCQENLLSMVMYVDVFIISEAHDFMQSSRVTTVTRFCVSDTKSDETRNAKVCALACVIVSYVYVGYKQEHRCVFNRAAKIECHS